MSITDGVVFVGTPDHEGCDMSPAAQRALYEQLKAIYKEAVPKALEPPLMNVGPTNDVNLVCRGCAALIHPANMDFHQQWHAGNP